jgi:hypothetical protein
VARLLFLDKSVTGLAKAEKADVYSYRVAAADDSPDILVGGPDLTSAKQMTSSNAFLSKYAWTRAELVDYVVTRGKQKIPLQGILHYPANYEAGKKYPMVVYLYEKLSDGLHNFQNPSERDYYNGTSLTQNGYFYFQPDIVFAPREPRRLRRGVRHRRAKQGDFDGRGDATKIGSWALVGRLRRHVPVDAHEAVRRGRVGRRHLGSHQQLRQPSLVGRHRRDRPHRDRAAAHGRAALRRLAGLHPQFRGLRDLDDDDATVAGGGGQ